MSRGKVIQPAVITYLQQRVGEVVGADEIAAAVGGLKGTVQRIMAALVADGHAEVVTHGNLWIFRGIHDKQSEPCGLYEYLATLKNGTILVQDEAGSVYRLTEMD